MAGFAKWLKEEDGNHGKRYLVIFRAVLMAALPLFCCFVYCRAQGRGLGEVFLPNSPWNDELFYYKQVEGILHGGYPSGYFGFNESHGLKLSFAAWSPVLLLPWILWGAVFGWNYMSPEICNLFLLSLVIFLFMIWVKPSWKQTGILAFLFCLYTPFVRYILSGMPEITCFSLLILFYGLVYWYLEKETAGRLCAIFAAAGLLTLMRPYMLLFLILPAGLCIKKYRLKGGICAGIVTAAVLMAYALIKHYFSAEYFEPLFRTEFITTFWEKGFGAGVHNFFGTFYWKGKDLWDYLVRGVKDGYAPGAFFAGFFVMTGIFAVQCLADFGPSVRAERKKQLVIEFHMTVSFIGMTAAELLMYKLEQGSKHFLTFMAAGIFVLAMMHTKTYKKAILMGAVFAYFYIYMATEPYDYQVPFRNQTDAAQLESWRTVFDENITLTEDDLPNYDNVIIWTLNDREGEEGNRDIYTKWQILYEAPEGMGISCCTKEYLYDNFPDLKSRYLMTLNGGKLDLMCAEKGCAEIGRDEDIVVYKLR